jgi:hypothetical protein
VLRARLRPNDEVKAGVDMSRLKGRESKTCAHKKERRGGKKEKRGENERKERMETGRGFYGIGVGSCIGLR